MSTSSERITRSMSRKRKHEQIEIIEEQNDNDGNDNNHNINQQNDNNNNDINEPPKKKQKLSVHQIDLKDYECPCCLELPNGDILQCENGHLICNSCYNKLEQLLCPTCKIDMSLKIRNRMAENTLSIRNVLCPNNGCDEEMQFKKLQNHIDNECGYTLINCKYKPLGCNWKNCKKDLMNHQNECNINMDDILNKINVLNVRVATCNKNLDIVSKAGSMNIVLINGADFGVHDKITFCSGSFSAYGMNWKFSLRIIHYHQWYELYAQLQCQPFPHPYEDYQALVMHDGYNDDDDDDDDKQYLLKPLYFEFSIGEETKTEWIQFEPRDICIDRIKDIMAAPQFKIFLK